MCSVLFTVPLAAWDVSLEETTRTTGSLQKKPVYELILKQWKAQALSSRLFTYIQPKNNRWVTATQTTNVHQKNTSNTKTSDSECRPAVLDAAVWMFHPLKSSLEGSFNNFRQMMRGEQHFHENIFSLITHDNGVDEGSEMEMAFWALFKETGVYPGRGCSSTVWRALDFKCVSWAKVEKCFLFSREQKEEDWGGGTWYFHKLKESRSLFPNMQQTQSQRCSSRWLDRQTSHKQTQVAHGALAIYFIKHVTGPIAMYRVVKVVLVWAHSETLKLRGYNGVQ